MRFRAFTVTPARVRAVGGAQVTPAAFGARRARRRRPAPAAAARRRPSGAAPRRRSATTQPRQVAAAAPRVSRGARSRRHDRRRGAAVQQAGFVAFPRDKMPAYTVPKTPIPAGLDVQRRARRRRRARAQPASTGAGRLRRLPHDQRQPDDDGRRSARTSRTSPRARRSRGGLYPNDTQHLALWIKNARAMKPGVIMPTLGRGEFDPVTKADVRDGTDRSADRRHRRLPAGAEVTPRHRRIRTDGNHRCRPGLRPDRQLRRRERPLELAHDRRSQADRHTLSLHLALLLPGRRPRSGDDPRGSSPGRTSTSCRRKRTTSCSRCTARRWSSSRSCRCPPRSSTI